MYRMCTLLPPWLNCFFLWLWVWLIIALGVDESTYQEYTQCHAKPCWRKGPFINSFKWNNGRHHPWGLWGDCWFACEHSLDKEEPDWGTAISETFVIIPTGQSPSAGHPSHPATSHSRLTLNELSPEARPRDKWRWHWCHLAGIHGSRSPPSLLPSRDRGRETRSPRYRPH